mmetsp:Transcript_11322/g.22784  ORF Transcript_11322/g.22784 Transcript_11322/m.22784 type:complete len:622 (-) Transcript_11322:161-2026(-)
MGPTTRIAQRLRELPCDRAIAGLFMDVKKGCLSVTLGGSRTGSELEEELQADSFLFADDATLLSKQFLVGKKVVFSRLQSDVWAMERWMTKWQMEFESTKTKLVIFSRHKGFDRASYTLMVGRNRISPVIHARCLGVWYDQEYKFTFEAALKVERYRAKMRLILRVAGPKWGCPPKHLLQLYTSVQRMQRRFIKRVLSVPRCAGGDVMEVYAKVPPVDLLLKKLSIGVLVRLVSGKDGYAREEYRSYLQSSRAIKDAKRKIATWQTPFGAMMKALVQFDMPLFPRGRMPSCKVEKFQRLLSLPEMPAHHKHYSEANKARAKSFGEEVLRSIPNNLTVLLADGGIGTDGQHYSAIKGWNPDGSSFQLVARLEGVSLSSHVAELIAFRMAISWANKMQIKVAVVLDSQSAVRASLSPTSTCVHARGNFRRLQESDMVQMVRWVPSHCGIVQNDEVDALTKGEDVDCLLRVSTTLKDHVRAAAQALKRLWTNRWAHSTNSPEFHRLAQCIPCNRSHIVGVHSARVMARLRTGYSGVPVFLHRHGLSSSRLCSECGAEGTVAHFFSCRARRTANQHLLTELEHIVGERVVSVVSLLSLKLQIGVQVRVGNAIVEHLLNFTEHGFL